MLALSKLRPLIALLFAPGIAALAPAACDDASSGDEGGSGGAAANAGAAGSGGAGGSAGGSAGGAGGAGGVAGASGQAGSASCPATGAPSSPPSIYLAFDGATLESVADGQDDATQSASSLVAARTTYPAFLAADPGRQALVDRLVADMRQALAAYAVEVTTARPAGDHMLIVFAGQDAGSLYGLVRHDCGNAVRNDVGVLFEGAADPARGRYALANEAIFLVARSIGLAKTRGPGHPCSCDPSGACTNETLCQLTPNAEVYFGTCADSPAVENEIVAFADAFGCR